MIRSVFKCRVNKEAKERLLKAQPDDRQQEESKRA